MKGIWRGDSDPLELINGKVYEILGVECDGDAYGVVDETGDSYLYPAEDFEIIEEDAETVTLPADVKETEVQG